jgi:hypothetical protein
MGKHQETTFLIGQSLETSEFVLNYLISDFCFKWSTTAALQCSRGPPVSVLTSPIRTGHVAWLCHTARARRPWAAAGRVPPIGWHGTPPPLPLSVDPCLPRGATPPGHPPPSRTGTKGCLGAAVPPHSLQLVVQEHPPPPFPLGCLSTPAHQSSLEPTGFGCSVAADSSS